MQLQDKPHHLSPRALAAHLVCSTGLAAEECGVGAAVDLLLSEQEPGVGHGHRAAGSERGRNPGWGSTTPGNIQSALV